FGAPEWWCRRRGMACPASSGRLFRASWSTLGKQHPEVCERLHLDGVARRVAEEHCHLVARFATEADVRLDDEAHTRRAQPLRQFVELRPSAQPITLPEKARAAARSSTGKVRWNGRRFMMRGAASDVDR